MKRWVLLCLFMGLGTGAVGCLNLAKDKEKDEKSEKSDKDDEDDGDSKKKKKSKKDKDGEDDDKSAKADKGDSDKKKKEEDEIDPKKLLEEDDGSDASGVLDVKLPDDDKRDAPSLGGGAKTEAALGGGLKWLAAGPLAVPNPGWQEIQDPPATVLLAPDKKAAIVFAPFTTPQDGTTKVDKIVAFLKLKNPKWKKAKQVTIGPDKVPALFGSGRATSPDGKTAKLFFSLIKTGGPQNLLAIGLADGDAPDNTLKTGMNIVGSIKKR